MFKRENTFHPRHNILSSDQEPMVKVSQSEGVDGSTRYSVSSDVLLERDGIAAILAHPLGEYPADWREVGSGLRDLTYPSRRVRRLYRFGRKAALLTPFEEVKPVARELAVVLDRNQDYTSTQKNMPVFTDYKQARDYITERMSILPPGRFTALLKSSIGDKQIFDELQALVQPPVASFDNLELQYLVDTSADEMQQMHQRSILAISNPRALSDIEQHVLEDELYATGLPAQFDGEQLIGGSRGQGIYIRREDIPAHLKSRDGLKSGFSLSLGPQLPDPDKRTGLDRFRVTFREQSARYVATPELTWETKRLEGGKVARRLVLEERDIETNEHTGIIRQRSTLAGAALLAAASTDKMGYDKVLARATPRHVNLGLARAGFWPLLAHYRENALLDHEYIRAVEAELAAPSPWSGLYD